MIIVTITSIWMILLHLTSIPGLLPRNKKAHVVYAVVVALLSGVMLWHPVAVFYLIMSLISLNTILTGYKKVLADPEMRSDAIDVHARWFRIYFYGLAILNLVLNVASMGVLLS
jgi:hypothetical protein